MFNDDTEIRFHYTTFPLPRFLFFSFMSSPRFRVHGKNWGENGKFSRALQKISHCGRIEERCCAFNLFFLF